MKLGRELSKYKFGGFLRGTQARKAVLIFSFGMIGWTALFTFYKYSTTKPSDYERFENYERRYQDYKLRVEKARARRLERQSKPVTPSSNEQDL